jgi:hypothetical protein
MEWGWVVDYADLDTITRGKKVYTANQLPVSNKKKPSRQELHKHKQYVKVRNPYITAVSQRVYRGAGLGAGGGEGELKGLANSITPL